MLGLLKQSKYTRVYCPHTNLYLIIHPEAHALAQLVSRSLATRRVWPRDFIGIFKINYGDIVWQRVWLMEIGVTCQVTSF